MKANREEKIQLLAAVILGKAPVNVLKPKSVLNLNLGRLNVDIPRFTFDGVAITMAKAFEGVYSNDIEYQITKINK